MKAYLAAELSTYGKEKFTFAGSKHAQGLLKIDDSNHFKVKEGRLVTYEHSFLGWIDWGESFSFDLSNWTAIYGRPLELFLSLHIATMMPELTYEIATNDCFNTKVHIGDQKLTINWNNGITDEEKEKGKSWIKKLGNDILQPADSILREPLGIFVEKGEYVYDSYSILDEDTNCLLVLRLWKVLGCSMILGENKTIAATDSELLTRFQAYVDYGTQEAGVSLFYYMKTVITTLSNLKSEEIEATRAGFNGEQKSEKVKLHLFQAKYEDDDFNITYTLGFNYDRYKEEMRLIKNSWEVASSATYLSGLMNHNNTAEKLLYAFANSIYVVKVDYGEKIFDYSTSLKNYLYMVIRNPEEFDKDIIFRYPYIRTVSNHWYYNDIDFMGGERQTTPYGAYELIDAKDLPRYFKFLIQEALPGGSGSGELQIFNDDDDQKILTQVCEPYLNEDEPNKYIKSLFTGEPYGGDSVGFRGKYYKYDGSMETARKIEIAKILDFYLRY